jgi:hypothetical protein
VEVDGDKKYVLDFHGKKINGQYALVKFQTGFLWVKVKNTKKASIIDYVRPTMNSQVWDLKQSPPKLNPEIRKNIIGTLFDSLEDKDLKPSTFIKNILISGSSTSYNYREDGDLDIDIEYSPEDLKENCLQILPDKDLHEYLKKAVYENNKKKIGSTSLTYSYMIMAPGDHPVSEGVYDVLNDTWIRGPIKIPESFDPDITFWPIKQRALSICRNIDLLINEILFTVDDMREIDNFEKRYHQIKNRRIILLHKLRTLCENLDVVHEWIWSLVDKSKDSSKAIYPAFDYSPNWEYKNILFKYIARYNYSYPIWNLYAKLKGDPYLEIVDQFIPS